LKNDQIKTVLETLGLSTEDVKIFLYLSKNGASQEGELKTNLNLHKKTISLSLKNLQKKGLVKRSSEQPILLFPIPFETALDSLLAINLEQTINLQKSKKDLLKDWDLL
jgi:HTH-type transcriptional regulator, sugar sensing transcriptional regulator